MNAGSSTPAVVVDATGTVTVSTVRLGPLGPRDVLIRTLFSGVSTGTDKWVMQGSFTWIDLRYPLVPGYQRAGIVEAVGDMVTEFVPGQQVVATESRPFSDAYPGWGGHVALAATTSDEVHDATSIDPARASLFVSAQVGFNAASRILGDAAQRVVVFGDGVIGGSGALVAQARGAEVLLIGRHAQRLDLLRRLGIATAASGDAGRRAIHDWQPTAVIDTVQNDQAFSDYIEVLPPRTGQVVFSGHSPGGVKAWADMELLQQRELTASFVSGWTGERIGATLSLMRDGTLPLELLADPPPTSARSIAELMRLVQAGKLRPVTAILDWRELAG